MIDPLDPRFNMALSLSAEQQAARLRREQQAIQPVQSLQPLQAGEIQAGQAGRIQEVGGQGLIGSRRLGQHLEGLLRDRPKFDPLRSGAAGVANPLTQEAEASMAQPQPAQEVGNLPPSSFRSREGVGRAVPDREQPEGPDLNMAWDNRLRFLQQGLPSSPTARAAMEMFFGVKAFA